MRDKHTLPVRGLEHPHVHSSQQNDRSLELSLAHVHADEHRLICHHKNDEIIKS